MPTFVAYAENKDGALRKGALEAVCEARRLADALGGDVAAVMLGANTSAAAELGQYGADRVLTVENEALGNYSNDLYLAALEAAVKPLSPFAVVFSASSQGKELSPMLAAKLGAGLAADCTKIEVDGGDLVITRPIFAGKAYSTLKITSATRVLSLRPNSVSVHTAAARSASVSAVAVSLPTPKTKVLAVKAAGGGKVDLTEAETIVAGGRGLKGPEHFALLEELASEIGAVVGASRAVVDAGWRPHGDQIGQTGKTVSPKLYFAVGVSGAIQHLAGMSSSKCIVAVNKDAEAPIFKVAHYGIVGDLFEVVPALTQAIRARKS